jgi:hypothetical protein
MGQLTRSSRQVSYLGLQKLILEKVVPDIWNYLMLWVLESWLPFYECKGNIEILKLWKQQKAWGKVDSLDQVEQYIACILVGFDCDFVMQTKGCV